MQDNNPLTRSEVLIHKIFAQTDEGRELLKTFKRSLMIVPTDTGGNDLFSLGKEEGRKTFIRNILLTIERAEKEIQ
jgi:hypothetical protein